MHLELIFLKEGHFPTASSACIAAEIGPRTRIDVLRVNAYRENCLNLLSGRFGCHRKAVAVSLLVV
jgi:hypothetical protein